MGIYSLDALSAQLKQRLKEGGFTYALDSENEGWWSRSGSHFVPATVKDIFAAVVDLKPSNAGIGTYRRMVKTIQSNISLCVETTSHFNSNPLDEVNTTSGVVSLVEGTSRDLKDSDRFTYTVQANTNPSSGTDERCSYVLHKLNEALRQPRLVLFRGKFASLWLQQLLNELAPVVLGSSCNDVRVILHGYMQDLNHLRAVAYPELSEENIPHLAAQWVKGPCFSLFMPTGARIVPLLFMAGRDDFEVLTVDVAPPSSILSAIAGAYPVAPLSNDHADWAGPSAVSQFLRTGCVRDEQLRVSTRDWYEALCAWCDSTGYATPTNQAAYAELRETTGITITEYVIAGLRLYVEGYEDV